MWMHDHIFSFPRGDPREDFFSFFNSIPISCFLVVFKLGKGGDIPKKKKKKLQLAQKNPGVILGLLSCLRES